jgi:hypothetical protein
MNGRSCKSLRLLLPLSSLVFCVSLTRIIHEHHYEQLRVVQVGI